MATDNPSREQHLLLQMLLCRELRPETIRLANRWPILAIGQCWPFLSAHRAHSPRQPGATWPILAHYVGPPGAKPYGPLPVAFTIAWMSARRASGSDAHRSMSRAKTGSIWGCSARSAPDSAPPASESATYFVEFAGSSIPIHSRSIACLLILLSASPLWARARRSALRVAAGISGKPGRCATTRTKESASLWA